ncbi:MAG: ABC transporter ATP-binding protein [Dehalococcoidia bacterium]
MLNVNIIEVKYYGVIRVLSDVSIQVPDKRIVATLGSNGAGKSTLLKSISGLLLTEAGEVSSGEITFNGKRIERMKVEDRVKLGITQLIEGRLVFTHMTVEENLEAGHYVTGKKSPFAKDREVIYSYFPRLRDLRKNVAGYLSGGEQQMLVIGRALMTKPQLFMLDEPSMGLAPIIVKEILDILKKMQKEQGLSVLLVEQNAAAALSIADYGYIMENGKVVLEGSVADLKNNPNIKEFYLGIGKEGEKIKYSELKDHKDNKHWVA